jgi:DNA-binding MarR family transcriptional regulator
MASRFELPALLSQALVAFTIELDNEFEHLMPQRTTGHGATGALEGTPWLVSMVMWCNCMRFLRPEGMTVGELGQLELPFPNCMPILRHGWTTTVPGAKGPAPRKGSDLRLSALLARSLLAFAVPFEQRADLSLAISANVVRVLSQEFVRAREVPRLSGVATEAIRIAVEYLDKRGYVEVKADVTAGRGHLVRLTDKGLKAQTTYRRLVSGIELRWRERFGAEAVDELRKTLELLAIPTANGRPPLFAGIEPYPDGWRATGRKRQYLPHFPVVLHRGGFPDGA